jgi:thiol:disulfide interchange protein
LVEATAHDNGKELPELGELIVTYQGCRENTVCYSRITKSIDLATQRDASWTNRWSVLNDEMIKALAAKLLRVAGGRATP